MKMEFDSSTQWRTTKTHSNEEMAECYRQVFFCFAQPMLRRNQEGRRCSGSERGSAAAPSDSLKDSKEEVSGVKTLKDMDSLFSRHCAIVGAIAKDKVMEAPPTAGNRNAVGQNESQNNIAAVGVKYLPIPSMLAGTVYDEKEISSSTKRGASLPPSLVAHLPFAFVESIFKTFGQVDYFHYEPERGVGTVIYRSGLDGEVCYVTKHLTSMVVPSIAHMRNGASSHKQTNIDDVFGDEIKGKGKGKSTVTVDDLPQLVPVVLYLEFSSFLPFFNPTLIANASEGSGISRHLLRTFPVPYDEKKKEGREDDTNSNEEGTKDEDWQLKPFTKATRDDVHKDKAGYHPNITLPFQRVWQEKIDYGRNSPTPSSETKKKEQKLEDETTKMDSSPATSIQKLVIEELLAARIYPSPLTPHIKRETGGGDDSDKAEETCKLPSLNYMDLWVAYVCRFVLWKPSFNSASLLATAGVFASSSQTTTASASSAIEDNEEEDEDDIAYHKRIEDGNRAVLSLALRSSTTLTDVLRLLTPVCLHKHAAALEHYLGCGEADEEKTGPTETTGSTLSPIHLAIAKLGANFIEYSVDTRRGMNLRRRLNFLDGFAFVSATSTGGDNKTKSEVRRDDGNNGMVLSNKNTGGTEEKNVLLQRLRMFHFDELIAVHYPALMVDHEKNKRRALMTVSSSAIITPLGSGEANFYQLCRRLVEDETLHCSMANIQYKLRTQSDAALAYWWLELKIRKLAAVHSPSSSTSPRKESLSVWDLHAATSDFSTKMGLEDVRAITFLSVASIVQLAMNAIDNAFLLMNMAAHPNGLPPRLLIINNKDNDNQHSNEKNKSPTDRRGSQPPIVDSDKSGRGSKENGPHVHLPPAEFPDVLNMIDEHALSGSAASLFATLVPPSWFIDPFCGSGQGDGDRDGTRAGREGGLGASLLAQQQKYSGSLGMLVMLFEAMAGPLKAPLIAMWLVGLVALVAVWAAGQ